jgi:hypothetical protein
MAEILVPDLDSVEVVRRVERAFRITIADAEAERCRTVGDLFSVVAQKVPIADRGALPCPTASAFWRLRAAFRQQHPGRKITPSTLLSDLMPATRRSAWWARLGQATGLDMPVVRPSPASRQLWVGWAIGFSVFGLALLCRNGPWVSSILGLVALYFANGGSGSSAAETVGLGEGATVGDLAKLTAGLNPALLAGSSSPMRRSEAWAALEAVLRDCTRYSGPVEKRTRFNAR